MLCFHRVYHTPYLLVLVELFEALFQFCGLPPDLCLQRVQVRLDRLPCHVHVPLHAGAGRGGVAVFAGTAVGDDAAVMNVRLA